jgi:hypothetical protein
MAAGATYEPIATNTLSTAATSITFSSIPATYTDLRLVFVPLANTLTLDAKMTFNGTSTGYSATQTALLGDGATASSAVTGTTSQIYINSLSISLTIPNLSTVDIFSYAGSTYKTSLLAFNEDRNGSGTVQRQVSTWLNTAAITSITITVSRDNFKAGTIATLYGIKAA